MKVWVVVVQEWSYYEHPEIIEILVFKEFDEAERAYIKLSMASYPREAEVK